MGLELAEHLPSPSNISGSGRSGLKTLSMEGRMRELKHHYLHLAERATPMNFQDKEMTTIMLNPRFRCRANGWFAVLT